MHILIADDHPIIIEAITQIIRKQLPDAKIYTVEFSKQIIPTIIKQKITHLILDIQLLDGNALKILDDIKEKNISLFTMIFTMSHIQATLLQYTKWQVWAIVNKSIHNSDLWKVVTNFLTQKEVYTIQSEHILKPDYSKIIATDKKDIFDTLSKNELTVMNMLIDGTSIKEIAFVTNNKATTIATYKRRLFEKLGVHSLIELIDLCRQYHKI